MPWHSPRGGTVTRAARRHVGRRAASEVWTPRSEHLVAEAVGLVAAAASAGGIRIPLAEWHLTRTVVVVIYAPSRAHMAGISCPRGCQAGVGIPAEHHEMPQIRHSSTQHVALTLITTGADAKRPARHRHHPRPQHPHECERCTVADGPRQRFIGCCCARRRLSHPPRRNRPHRHPAASWPQASSVRAVQRAALRPLTLNLSHDRPTDRPT